MASTDLKFETPLCEIAYRYGTDKCPQIGHHYTPYYYELLKEYRNSFRKVVELGIGTKGQMGRRAAKHYVTGASLYMWRDFFPNAQVYGVDFLSKAMFEAERIETILCDERYEEELKGLINKTGSDIDMFIDDGNHMGCYQVFACEHLLPLLNPNVIYIIEDVKHPRGVMRGLRERNIEHELVSFDFNETVKEHIIIVSNRSKI